MSYARRIALRDLALERDRQEAKHGINTAAHPDSMTHSDRLAILVEEVGEVAHELNEAMLGFVGSAILGERLRAELVQVGAVAVAWIEAIDAMEGM